MQKTPNSKKKVAGISQTTGHRPPTTVASRQSSVVGHRLFVVGHQSSVVGCLSSVVGLRPSVAGRQSSSSSKPTNFLIFCLAILCVFSSCTPVKNTTYFQGIKNDTTLTNLVSKDFEPKIQKGDLLSITVASLSPENTAIYNAPQNIEGTATGYLVDKNGNINFFKLDTLHVEGMTRKELKQTLEKDLIPYLAQTVVAVGFLNRHITMIGALSQVMPMANDHMTILDALATDGDIGERGMTDDVLVIREKDNGKEFKKLDLTDESIFHSPYFYLQPNDIIYIKPVKKKSENTTRIISYVTAGISFIFIIIDRIIK